MKSIRTKSKPLAELENLLKTESLRTLFQPIVTFRNDRPETYAVEALTRGPETSQLSSAKKLFNTAEKKGELDELEFVSRKLAIERFSKLRVDTLFLNLDPNLAYKNSFDLKKTLNHLQKNDIDQSDVVFEITERNEIKDREALEEAIRHLRNQNFNIAVDDVGAGYANLDIIAHLQPDFIKIDMSLIRDLHRNRSQSKLVETIIDLADRIGSDIIGEGIEKKEELQTLLSMGMNHGQGFLISPPKEQPGPLNGEINQIHNRCHTASSSKQFEPSMSELADTVKTFPPDTLTKDIYRFLDNNPEKRSITLTVNDKPVGLLMRKHLHEKLSTNVGQSLYWRRPIRRIMEDDPIIVPSDASLSETSELVTDRGTDNFVTEVLVVDPITKHYKGNVSLRKLLKKITVYKTKKAKRANPLTGLPGNIEIRNRIHRNLNRDRNFALIYVDIDNFKPFNDVYGFERGDEAIILLKDMLRDGLKVYPNPENFLGHVGGDDFVVITGADQAEDFCRFVIERFDGRIGELYDSTDLEKGCIRTKNRTGDTTQFDFMTLSLAVVTNVERNFESHLEMSEVAAEVKKYVKQNRKESTFHVDRRTD